MKRRTFLKSVAAGSALAMPATTLAQDASTPVTEATPAISTAVESGYAPVNGLEIYYEIHGSGGTPLLLLHGAYMSIDAMAPFVTALAATRQVIAFEAQGHARTADIDRPITYEFLADDAAALLDHLGIEQADVFGYSMGGNTSIQLAIRHPEKVRKLIPTSCTFRLDGWDPRVRELIATITPEVFTDTPFEVEYLRLAPNPEDWPTLIEKLVALDTTVPQDIPVSDLEAIAAPALVIAGDQDSVIPAHVVEMFLALGGGTPGDLGLPGPKAQLAILPNTTHIGVMFMPEQLLAIIPPFLDAPIPDEATPAA